MLLMSGNNAVKLREGDSFNDERYGEAQVIHVGEKEVFYYLPRQKRVHRTSHKRVLEFVSRPTRDWMDGARWKRLSAPINR